MRLPTLFLSHGSPQLVLEGGDWALTLRKLGKRIEPLNPELILVVSAHWLTPGTQVECSEEMKTLHDFHGFSPELYELTYPARGNPKLCQEIAEDLGAKCERDRGLDHGAWAVLWHLFPDGRFPVTQLSIDVGRELKEHLALAERLRSLRDRVLLIGSGGAVHNLRDAILNPEGPPQWAVDFKERLKNLVLKKDVSAILNYRNSLGRLAHPTEEHLIPLIYFLGSLYPEEKVSLLYDGFEFGSISLLSFVGGLHEGIPSG